jgi:hypothetical protein
MTAPITIDGMGITLRPFKPSDRAYVEDTWIRSAGDAVRNSQKAAFYRWFRPLVEQHVSLDYVRIACPTENPDAILGWAALREGHPLFAYTLQSRRLDMRGKGLARALTEAR